MTLVTHCLTNLVSNVFCTMYFYFGSIAHAMIAAKAGVFQQLAQFHCIIISSSNSHALAWTAIGISIHVHANVHAFTNHGF